MADYKGIQGYSVQKLSSDPTASEATGQLWYNSTAGKFKVGTAGAGTWATGNNINTARRYLSGVGSSTAGLLISGNAPGVNYCESFDGTCWTEVADLSANIMTRGRAGTQTAALAGGGVNGGAQANCESWNGSAWTEVNNVNVSKYAFAGSMGVQTAALIAGGTPPATPADAETWDGTCWTEGNNINNARNSGGGCGTTTASLIFGGTPPTPSLGVHTESYDGTSWTETNNLNVGRYGIGGSGLQTAAIAIAGGTPTWVDSTELWDGTSWTEAGNLGTAVRWAGNSTITATNSAFNAGGLVATPASTATTEIWTNPVYAIKTVTVS